MYLTDASEMVFFFQAGCSKSSSCDTSSVEQPLIALVLEVITRSLFTIYNLIRNLRSLIKYVVDVGTETNEQYTFLPVRPQENHSVDGQMDRKPPR